jgi:hypothetical protein
VLLRWPKPVIGTTYRVIIAITAAQPATAASESPKPGAASARDGSMSADSDPKISRKNSKKELRQRPSTKNFYT